MLSEKQTLIKREKLITWLIAMAVALALSVAFFGVIKNQAKSPAKVDLRNKMLLDVRYWLFREGYTVPVITIRNLQDVAMQECRITVNDKYIFEISEILSGDDSRGIMIIKTNNLVREDGAIFNPSSDPARSVCVICKRPFYGIFCGDFYK